MRIVIEIEIDKIDTATTDLRPSVTVASPPRAADAGGPPPELVAAVERAAARPTGGAGTAARSIDAGGPPASLLAAVGDPAAPADRS